MDRPRIPPRFYRFVALLAGASFVLLFWAQLTGALAWCFRVVAPVLWGAALAYVLNLPLMGLEKRAWPHSKKTLFIRLRRPLCLLLSLLLVTALLVILIALIIPQIIAAVELIAKEAPNTLREVLQWVEQNPRLFPPESEWIDTLRNADASFAARFISGLTVSFTDIMNPIVSAATTLSSGLYTGMIATFVAIYLLIFKERILVFWKHFATLYIKRGAAARVAHIASVAHTTFSAYLIGQGVDGLAVGILTALGMALLGLPFAPMIGAFVGATTLVPLVGGYVGIVVGVLVLLTVDVNQALIFLIFIAILKTIEGNFLYPRIIGQSMGMPTLLVLFALILAGGMWGVAGMILGVPMMATAYRLLKEDMKHREEEKHAVP